MIAGAHDNWPEVCEGTFMTANDALVKHRGRQIPVDRPGVANPVVFNTVFADVWAKVLGHAASLLCLDWRLICAMMITLLGLVSMACIPVDEAT
jgi:hypothetical protein